MTNVSANIDGEDSIDDGLLDRSVADLVCFRAIPARWRAIDVTDSRRARIRRHRLA